MCVSGRRMNRSIVSMSRLASRLRDTQEHRVGTLLDRKPEEFPDLDDQARSILRDTPSIVDSNYAKTIDHQSQDALDFFSVRSPTLALHAGSGEILREGMLAMAVSDALHPQEIDDKTNQCALYFVCAQRLGISPQKLFDETADRVDSPKFQKLMREFGHRQFVTLSEFG